MDLDRSTYDLWGRPLDGPDVSWDFIMLIDVLWPSQIDEVFMTS